MKQTAYKFIMVIIALAALAMITTSFKLYDGQSPNAVTEKVNGVDVYVFSRPVREYVVIKSSVSNLLVFNKGDGVIMRSAKKAFEEKGDGVIVHLNNSRYEVIKYK